MEFRCYSVNWRRCCELPHKRNVVYATLIIKNSTEMKNLYKTFTKVAIVFIAFAFLVACDDKHDFNLYDESIDTNLAKLKFVHAAVGPNGTNFSINYSINDKKISAVGVTVGLPLGFSYGNSYPSPLNYALVQSGTQTMKIVIPARAIVRLSRLLSLDRFPAHQPPGGPWRRRECRRRNRHQARVCH